MARFTAKIVFFSSIVWWLIYWGLYLFTQENEYRVMAVLACLLMGVAAAIYGLIIPEKEKGKELPVNEPTAIVKHIKDVSH